MFKNVQVLLIFILASNLMLEIAQASNMINDNMEELSYDPIKYQKALFEFTEKLQNERNIKEDNPQLNKLKNKLLDILLKEIDYLKKNFKSKKFNNWILRQG